MQTEPVDIEVGAKRIRIVCGDVVGSKLLREALREVVSPIEAPLGFVVSAPTAAGGFFIFTDRAGFVLGRARTAEQVVAMVAGHVTALSAVPQAHLRLRMRTVVSVGHDVAWLVAWPLLLAPPVIERKLAGLGYAVVDSLLSDVDPTTPTIAGRAALGSANATSDPGPGHAHPSADAVALAGLLLLGIPGAQPTRAQAIAQLVGAACAGQDRRYVFDAAEQLEAALDLAIVEIGSKLAIYDVLGQL